MVTEGAEVIVADVNEQAIERVRAAHPDVVVAPNTEALVREPIDVYAPCALGSALDDLTVTALRARSSAVAPTTNWNTPAWKSCSTSGAFSMHLTMS